jgi:SAM-dependent methyltransferase
MMAFREELEQILVCPICHASVCVLPGNQQLKCISCDRLYHIEDGFPIMLQKQASSPPDCRHTEETRAYHLGERMKSNTEQYLSQLLSPLEVTDNSTFLDVGCGSGYVNDYMASRKHLKHNIGFDLDLDAVRLGRNLETKPGHVLWFCGSALAVPLADLSVDHLVCRVVLPFVSINQVTSEIARLIRPAGTIALSLHPWSFYLPWFSLRPQNWKKAVAGSLIFISGLWFSATGKEFQFHLGRHKIAQTFQTEYRMRQILQRHGLDAYHVVREPEFIIYAKSVRPTPARTQESLP